MTNRFTENAQSALNCAPEMAAKLGLDGIKKVVYNIDEIV